MVDVTALEREYLAATRPSAFDARRARLALDALHEASADPSLLVLYEAKLLAQTHPEKRDQSLQAIFAHLAQTTVIDPTVAAKCLVMMTKYAMNTYNRHAIAWALDYAKRLWANNHDNSEVIRWRPAVELNAGILFVRINDLTKAQAHFDAMLATYERAPETFCWLTQINVYLAVIHARLGNIEGARRHAVLADETGMPYDEANRCHAWGEILLTERRYEDARQRLHEAYRLAKRDSDPDVMADAQLALCHVYKAMSNADALWYAQERVTDIAAEHGMIHLLDALGALNAGTAIT